MGSRMKSSKPRFTRRRLLLGGPLLVILCGGLWYLNWSVLEHRLITISDGRVYQSGEMPLDDLADVVAEHGIKTVIDLRLEPEHEITAERKALSGLGVRYEHIPSTHDPVPKTVDAFLAVTDNAENFPILIHCGHGVGRSVLFAAVYRIEYEGWDADTARRACRLFPWRGTFSPDGPKGSFLLRYRRRQDPPK